MSLKEWTAVFACLSILLIGSHAHAQSSASAASDQSQGQSQSQIGGVGTASAYAGQGQSQYTGGSHSSSAGGSVANSGNSAVSFKDSFNGAPPIRYLPVPSAIPMENYQAQIFGGPNYRDNGPNFVSMRQLVAAMNLVDLEQPITGADDIKIIVQPLSVSDATIDSVIFEVNDGEAINHGFQPVAMLTVAMEEPDESNSASLALAIGKKAKEMNAGRVVFTTEGSSKKLYSSGWGIGLSYNYASVGSDASDAGSVGAGGTGYSQGQAGYKNLIYLSAIIGN